MIDWENYGLLKKIKKNKVIIGLSLILPGSFIVIGAFYVVVIIRKMINKNNKAQESETNP